MKRLIIYYFVSALIMCLAITVSIHFDEKNEIEEMCKKEKVPLKIFIVCCTLLGFVTLPYALITYFRDSFKE